MSHKLCAGIVLVGMIGTFGTAANTSELDELGSEFSKVLLDQTLLLKNGGDKVVEIEPGSYFVLESSQYGISLVPVEGGASVTLQATTARHKVDVNEPMALALERDDGVHIMLLLPDGTGLESIATTDISGQFQTRPTSIVTSPELDAYVQSRRAGWGQPGSGHHGAGRTAGNKVRPADPTARGVRSKVPAKKRPASSTSEANDEFDEGRFPSGDLSQIPVGHPARGMANGAMKTVGGVTLESPGRSWRSRVIVSGLPIEDQPPAPEEEDVDPKDNPQVNQARGVAKQKNRSWFVERRTKGLAKSKRGKVLSAYSELDVSVESVRRGIEEKSLSPEIGRKQIAKAFVVASLAERRAFGKDREKVPRGNPFRDYPEDSITPELVQSTEHTVESVLRGDYLKKRTPAITSRGVGFQQTTSYPLNGEIKLSFSQACPEPKSEWGVPRVTHYEFRVLTAEHRIPDLLHDFAAPHISEYIPHVSVVAGIWRVLKEHGQTEIFGNGCQVVGQRKLTRVTEEFVRWIVGHGAASEYLEGDRLKTKHVFGPYASYGEAYRFALSHTPTKSGYYYPIRAVAYSIGDYGINWICHNLANAFTKRRWGIIVTNYDYLGPRLFGLYGNRGISKRKDMLGVIHKGCVPFNQCYWNMPLQALGVLDLAGDAAGGGTGFGLSSRWHPKTNAYVPTYAKYEHKSIPIEPRTLKRILDGWQ